MDNMNIFTYKQKRNSYEKCGVCKYRIFQGCQRHAPVKGEDTHHLTFPHVEEDDYCGDFEHRLSIEVLQKELEKCKDQYFQLIMSVTQGNPDESHHETVLRYIREAEKEPEDK